MQIEQLVFLIYCVPFFIAIQMARRNIEAFPSLPEKMPIHFGLSGRPDGWMKKGKFTTYFNPAMCIFISLTMFLSFFYFPYRESNAVPVEFSGCGALISLACAWLFVSVNNGSIDVALGKSDGIWKYMAKPLAGVLIASLLPVASISLSPKKLELSGSAVTTWVSTDGRKHNSEQTVFNPDVSRIYVWTDWKWLNAKRIRYEWYNPDGVLYFKFERYIGGRNIRFTRNSYSYIDVAGQKASGMPGIWKVMVFVEREKFIEKTFEIKAMDSR